MLLSGGKMALQHYSEVCLSTFITCYVTANYQSSQNLILSHGVLLTLRTIIIIIFEYFLQGRSGRRTKKNTEDDIIKMLAPTISKIFFHFSSQKSSVMVSSHMDLIIHSSHPGQEASIVLSTQHFRRLHVSKMKLSSILERESTNYFA